jgi:hypothetical protein
LPNHPGGADFAIGDVPAPNARFPPVAASPRDQAVIDTPGSRPSAKKLLETYFPQLPSTKARCLSALEN